MACGVSSRPNVFTCPARSASASEGRMSTPVREPSGLGGASRVAERPSAVQEWKRRRRGGGTGPSESVFKGGGGEGGKGGERDGR